ncbi:MAG: pyrroline-5-carboxylate reductase, partial [Bacteroidetes bacterium]
GTTEAALAAYAEAQLDAGIDRGAFAALQRAVELGSD